MLEVSLSSSKYMGLDGFGVRISAMSLILALQASGGAGTAVPHASRTRGKQQCAPQRSAGIALPVRHQLSISGNLPLKFFRQSARDVVVKPLPEEF